MHECTSDESSQSLNNEIVNARLARSETFSMKSSQYLTWTTAIAVALLSLPAQAQQRAQYEKLVAVHARANNVPEILVHRVIVRESKYHPDLVGRGGTIGLMQIKLATARGLGYTGDASGLRDPDTNLTYGVKYLAGAYRAAEGDHARTIRYFASGYYYVAKRQRLERRNPPEPTVAIAPPKETEAAPEAATEPAAEPKEAGKPVELTGKPIELVANRVPLPRKDPRKLAHARTRVHAQAEAPVPRPPAPISGANATKPR